MSEIMLEAVLRMPPNLWDGSEIDVMQRHSRYVQAADELTTLRQQLAEAKKDAVDAKRYRWYIAKVSAGIGMSAEAISAEIDQAMLTEMKK